MNISRSRTLAVSGTLALTVAVAGCNDTPPVHTSEYYRLNPVAATERLQTCDQSSLSMRDADCANAVMGQLQGSLKARPTVNPWKS